MGGRVLLICLARLLISQHRVDAATVMKYDQSQHGTYNVQIHLKNLEVIAVLDESMFSGGAENDIYDYDYTDVSGMTSQKPASNSSSTTEAPSLLTPTTISTTTLPSKPVTTTTTGNKNVTNNRLTTIINAKVTPRPNKNNTLGNKLGSGSDKKYNATNMLNIVMPSSSLNSPTKAPPHNKISEGNSAQVKGSTTAPSVVTTAGTTFVTSSSDTIDYTLMDTLSIPVEIQQPPSAAQLSAQQPPSAAAQFSAQQAPSAQLSVQQAPLHPNPMRKCAPGYFRDSSGKCRRIRKPHLPFLQMVHTPGVIKSFQGAESSTKKMVVPESASHPKTKEDKLVMDLAAKMSKEDGPKVLNSH